MDAYHQSQHCQSATFCNPGNSETEQAGISGSVSGYPVEPVAPQASVCTETPARSLLTSLRNMSVTSVPGDQTLLPQTAPEGADRSSGHSAGSKQPAAVANTAQALQQDSLGQISERVMLFRHDPAAARFRQLEQLIDQHFDLIAQQPENMALRLALAIARISEKYNWQIRSSTLGELALEILEGKSDLASFINSDRVSAAKLDMWWISFFVTGDDKYLKKIAVLTGSPAERAPLSAIVLKMVTNRTFRKYSGQYPEVKEFARQMCTDSSLSHDKRAYFHSIIRTPSPLFFKP